MYLHADYYYYFAGVFDYLGCVDQSRVYGRHCAGISMADASGDSSRLQLWLVYIVAVQSVAMVRVQSYHLHRLSHRETDRKQSFHQNRYRGLIRMKIWKKKPTREQSTIWFIYNSHLYFKWDVQMSSHINILLYIIILSYSLCVLLVVHMYILHGIYVY